MRSHGASGRAWPSSSTGLSPVGQLADAAALSQRRSSRQAASGAAASGVSRRLRRGTRSDHRRTALPCRGARLRGGCRAQPPVQRRGSGAFLHPASSSAEVSVPSHGHRRRGIRVVTAPPACRQRTARASMNGSLLTSAARTLCSISRRADPESVWSQRWTEPSGSGRLDLIAVDAIARASSGRSGAGATCAQRPGHLPRAGVHAGLGLERRLPQRSSRMRGLPQPVYQLLRRGLRDRRLLGSRAVSRSKSTAGTHHRTAEQAFEEDRLRQENLKLAGIDWIRITGRRIETRTPSGCGAAQAAIWRSVDVN